MESNVFSTLKIDTPPTEEPLSLKDVNAFLRLQPPGVDPEADDFINTIITTSRQHIETAILRRCLLTQKWKLLLKTWPGRDYAQTQKYSGTTQEYLLYNHIKIPMPPLQSVDSISYITSAGITKTVTPVDPPVSTQTTQFVNVFKDVVPAQIVLPFSAVWPTDILMPGIPITIGFTAGYTDLGALSTWEGFGPTIQAMKLLIVDCWENRIPSPNRENLELENVVAKWLTPYRVYE